MRINEPVTSVEIEVRENQSIVSKTDPTGRITYVNQDFLDISGFTAEELIGQPHNIVRHPDMPEEVYADMWSALNAGRPWTGVVKNRCRSGNFYWVKANATPVRDAGQVVGFLSVRTRPSRAEVAAAETAYRELRGGRAGHLRIRDGCVVPARSMRLAAMLRSMTIKQQISGTLGLLIVVMLLVGGFGLRGMLAAEGAMQTLYDDRVLSLERLKVVSDMYAVSIVDTAHKTRNGNMDWADGKRNLDQASARLHESLKDYAGRHLAEGESKLFAETDRLMKAADVATDKLRAIIERKDAGAIAAFTIDELYPAIDPVTGKIGDLVDLQLRVAKTDVDSARAHSYRMLLMSSASIVAAVVLSIVLGWMLMRSIRRPIDEACGYFSQMAEGRLGIEIDATARNEVARILDAAKSMKIKLGFDLAEANRIASENQRIRTALDFVQTNVCVADNEGNILHINETLRNTMRRLTPRLRQTIPDFDADAVIGRSIGMFHADPDAALERSRNLDAQTTTRMDIGGRTFDVISNLITDTGGKRLGTVDEWLDRTDQLMVERELEAVVRAAKDGDFSKRIDPAGKDGFHLQLANNLNAMLDNCATSLCDVARALNAIARGDLTHKIDAEYAGTFGQLKDDTNTTVERLKEVVGQIKEATGVISMAAQEISAGNADLSARTEEQASRLEETASSMEQINATVKQNADNARQANELTRSSNEVAERGGAMVAKVVDTMGAIQESSKKIADIVGVIDSIAFQTNILAFNAAVEAARAGEQGRGFAVVASEVRSLAQRSATAAKEIKTLIASSVGKVDDGAKLVQEAGQTMTEVVSSFQKVARYITEIAEASREQSAGIEQIAQAVGHMDEATQQNAAMVGQAAAAAESLEEQARSLVHTVAMFRLDEAASSVAAPQTTALVERRGPNRPKNVARLPATTPSSTALKRVASAAALGRGDGEWAEF